MPERNYEQEAIKAAGFTMPDQPANPQPEPQEEQNMNSLYLQ